MFKGGEWVETPMSGIKKGDIFRVFESDGSPVASEGATEFRAASDAEMIESGGKQVPFVDIE